MNWPNLSNTQDNLCQIYQFLLNFIPRLTRRLQNNLGRFTTLVLYFAKFGANFYTNGSANDPSQPHKKKTTTTE